MLELPGPAGDSLSAEQWERRLRRERQARLAAEQLLESKSLELFGANQALAAARDRLEIEVQQRTAELEAALARAGELAEARNRFLALMAHEIRTPISALIGLLDLLQNSGTAEREEYLRSARAASGHLLDLVNDVLDLAKLEAGRLVLVPQRFDPRLLIEDAVRLLQPLLGRKPVRLAADLAVDLPAAVVADDHRFRQILLNLAGNAIKFTEKGSVTIRATRAGTAERPMLRVEVEDTGPGIPEQDADRLFSEFVQADLMRQKQVKGTGLGLAICKRIAEAMGGSIGFRSRFGEGATFWFEVAAPAADGDAASPAARAAAGICPARVLLAEDTPTLQLVIAAMLRQGGHSVAVASSGTEALALLAERDFDLAILDLQMPDLDGDEVIRAIRAGTAGPPALPALVLTAAADPESLARIRAAGADGLLLKPVPRDELLAAVAAAIAA